jgi:short subunit dehydrogenase-like uncharacterized protein
VTAGTPLRVPAVVVRSHGAASVSWVGQNAREFDIVLFGATGFTGGLTAGYLAGHRPPGLRLALAGRDPRRLADLAGRLGGDIAVATADVTDPDSLARLAASTRVLATTVGPYLRHGEPLVAACARAGTDYLDLTGEPEFVDRMYLRHHETALASGARLVHSCGFDSVPHDLGALFTVGHLPPDAPIRLRGYVTARGSVSGGTLDSALTALGRVRAAGREHARRRAVEPRDQRRRARAVSGRPGWDPDARAWVLPLPTIDPLVVVRSAAALPRYGPDFRYTHLVALRGPAAAAGLAAGTAGLFALAQVPATRALLRRLRPAGSGPDEAQRARNWFRVRFLGEAPGHRVWTEVAGGDPGYGETARMFAESALCLAGDDLPETAGQVTPAVAMGGALVARLRRAGIRFAVLPDGPGRAAPPGP